MKLALAMADWRSLCRKKFEQQKYNAKDRGIPFFLSFEQWLAVWERSQHLPERGVRSDQYVMARKGDRGAYEIGNVYITTQLQNSRDQVFSAERRAKTGNAGKISMMTARQFLAAIHELGLETPYQAAPKLGVSLAQAHRYANGTTPIPRQSSCC